MFAIKNIKALFKKENYDVYSYSGAHNCKNRTNRVEKRTYRVHSIESLIAGNNLGILLDFIKFWLELQ